MKQLIVFILVILGVTFTQQTPLHAASNTYAALGDSVAAGAGLPSSDATCKRSSQSYPYTVATKTGLPLQHLACSGAKTDEGIYGSQKVGDEMVSQLNQAYTGVTPSLITITVGANDARWTQFIRQCYYIRCGYKVDTARFAAYLVDLKLELNIAMAKISTLSKGTPPQVIVTGYYNAFSKTTCDDTSGLTSSEITWLKNRTSALNNAISGVTSKYSYARFASTNFSGHELCTSEPWIQGLTDAMPFHPNAAGQEAIARSVMTKYKTTNQPSTTPSSSREKLLNLYNRYRK